MTVKTQSMLTLPKTNVPSQETLSPGKKIVKIYLRAQVFWGMSLVIIQKVESQNGCYKKTKHAKFSQKRTFLTDVTKFILPQVYLPLDTYMCLYISGGKKCSFFRKFGLLCFLVIPVMIFAFLPYYQQIYIAHNTF